MRKFIFSLGYGSLTSQQKLRRRPNNHVKSTTGKGSTSEISKLSVVFQKKPDHLGQSIAYISLQVVNNVLIDCFLVKVGAVKGS